MSVTGIQASSQKTYWEGFSRKKLPAKKAVHVTVIAVYILFVEKVFVTCLQITAAASRRMGFTKLDPSGVEAANIMSPISKPTSKQTASGPLVIKPVNVPILLLFLRHSMSISMARPIQSMSKIIPAAPTEAKRISPSKSRELPTKKIRTSVQAVISRRLREFDRNFFKIVLVVEMDGSAFVAVNEISNCSFAQK